KNFIFVDATLRNDWLSSLQLDKNNYLFPSVSTSIVFTDIINSPGLKSVLNFGKLRAAYGRSGSVVPMYALNPTYGLGTPYGANATMGVPTTVYDPALKPSLSSEYEIGTELQFLKNRIGVDFTWYRKDGTDQIIPLSVTPSSGSSTVYINAGL